MTQLLAASSNTMGISTRATANPSAEPNRRIDEPSSPEDFLELWSGVLGIRDSLTLDSCSKCRATKRQDTGSVQDDLARFLLQLDHEEDEAWWLANEEAAEGPSVKSESTQRQCQGQAAGMSSESSTKVAVPTKIFDGPAHEKPTERRTPIVRREIRVALSAREWANSQRDDISFDVE